MDLLSNPLIVGVILFIIEYVFFADGRSEWTIFQLLKHFAIIAPVLAFLLILGSNTLYYGTTPNQFIVTVVLIISILTITSKILLDGLFRLFSVPQIRIPDQVLNIIHRIPRMTWRTVSPWVVIGLVGLMTPFVFPLRNTIIILPIKDNPNAQALLSERLNRFFDSPNQDQVTVRSPQCFIFGCPSPETITAAHPEVLIVISGVSVDAELSLRFDRQCNLEFAPLPQDEPQYTDCISEERIASGVRNIDAYLPIFMLKSVSVSEGNAVIMREWIKKAISSLSIVSTLASHDAAWTTYANLFHAVLYNTPFQSTQERIENAGAILGIAEKFYGGEERYRYLNALYFEERGVISRDSYYKAIAEYQGLFSTAPTSPRALNGLSRISMKLRRYADAVCYTNESLLHTPDKANQLTLAAALQELGAKLHVPGGGERSAEDIRRELIANKDGRSVIENLRLALIAYQNRDYDTALNYITTIKQSENLSDVELASTYFLEGQIYRNRDNYEKAITSLEQFLRIAKVRRFSRESISQAYRLIGQTYHSMGFHNQSSQAYSDALGFATSEQTRLVLLSNQVTELILTSEYQMAQSQLKVAQSYYTILKDSLDPNEQSDYLEMLSNVAITEGDQERITNLEQVVQGYTTLINNITSNAKGDFDGCIWLSTQLYKSSNPYMYLKPFVNKPAVPSVYYQRRRFANGTLGNSEAVRIDAELEIERLEKTQHTAADYYNLGRAYASIGRHEDALVALQKAIDLDNPGITEDIADAADYYVMGNSYAALNRIDEAIIAYRKSAIIQERADKKSAAYAYEELSNMYRKQNRYAEAIAAQEKALEYLPDAEIKNKIADLLSLGEMYQQLAASVPDMSKYGEVVRVLNEALTLQTNEAEQAMTWRKIAEAYRNWANTDSTKYAESIKAWKKAVEVDNPVETSLDRDRADISDWFDLGVTYRLWATMTRSEDSFTQSIRMFEKSIALSDSDQTTAGYWYNIGLTYREWAKDNQSKYVEAINAWNKAITSDYPEETKQGVDTHDIADYVQIAKTYIEWSQYDATKKELIRPTLDSAINIPIDEANGDYHWHQQAIKLKQEITSGTP